MWWGQTLVSIINYHQQSFCVCVCVCCLPIQRVLILKNHENVYNLIPMIVMVIKPTCCTKNESIDFFCSIHTTTTTTIAVARTNLSCYICMEWFQWIWITSINRYKYVVLLCLTTPKREALWIVRHAVVNSKIDIIHVESFDSRRRLNFPV